MIFEVAGSKYYCPGKKRLVLAGNPKLLPPSKGEKLMVQVNKNYFFRQCVDVYDEKCETKYPAKCTEDQSCTMVYQTKCDTVGYNQKCQQVPVQKCQQITKCHRIPKTTCRPFKKEKCGKKPVQVPKKKMMHKCLPYESRIPEDVTSCANENPSSAYGAPSSGNGAPSSSYGAPQGSSYSAPVKTLSDMIAPAGIQKSRKVHREFIALHNPFQVQFHNLHQSKITPPPLRIQFRSEMQCNPIKTLMDHL